MTYDTFDGTGVRDFVHVIDLVQGHIKALEKKWQNKNVSNVNNHNYDLLSKTELKNLLFHKWR